MIVIVLSCMSFLLCACSKKSSESKADKKEDARQKYIDEIGKTKKGEQVVCYKAGEIYETYYIAHFTNDKMDRMTEYRLYSDKEANGKSCFDTDMEFYTQQESFKKADKDLKVAIFEQKVSDSSKAYTYEEWYNEKLKADYKIVE